MKKWTVSLLLCLFSLLLVACGGKGAAEGEKKDSLICSNFGRKNFGSTRYHGTIFSKIGNSYL